MTTPDYEALYNDLIETMTEAGLDVSSLQKGDEKTEYRSAGDYLALLNFFRTESAKAAGASTRTNARLVRETV